MNLYKCGFNNYILALSRDISVSTVTSLCAGQLVQFPAGRDFSLHHRFQVTHELLSNGYQGPFCKVKWPEHKADHWLSCNVIKNGWSHTSTPPYVNLAWYLVKHGLLWLLTFVFLTQNIILFLSWFIVLSTDETVQLQMKENLWIWNGLSVLGDVL